MQDDAAPEVTYRGDEPEKGIMSRAWSAVRSVSGQKKIDREGARAAYAQADRWFNEAKLLTGPERTEQFLRAAGQYEKAASIWPEGALEQDAMLMKAECLFFANDLTAAEEAYTLLLKEHPRNRHVDRIVARKFEIAQYWKDSGKVKDFAWYWPNLNDETRPLTSSREHAIRLLDQIRYDDPTGRLADDATMAAGVEMFEQGEYERADDFFTDLRKTFPDSEHFFLAHLLGLRCKLEIYQGPAYGDDPLLQAEELIDKMYKRFPGEARGAEHGAVIAKIGGEVRLLKAQRHWHLAEFYVKKGENAAARYHLQQIVKSFSDTSLGPQAQQQLEALEGEPDTPVQRLAWLADVFQDAGDEPAPIQTAEGTTLLR